MNLRFYVDPETGSIHIYRHGVEEREVEDAIRVRGEVRPRGEGSRVAIGRTRGVDISDRSMRRDPEPNCAYVITAYELIGKRLIALSQADEKARKMRNANRFPDRWDEDRVRRLLDHYESQTEDETAAEDEAVLEDPDKTLMEIPKKISKNPKMT